MENQPNIPKIPSIKAAEQKMPQKNANIIPPKMPIPKNNIAAPSAQEKLSNNIIVPKVASIPQKVGINQKSSDVTIAQNEKINKQEKQKPAKEKRKLSKKAKILTVIISTLVLAIVGLSLAIYFVVVSQNTLANPSFNIAAANQDVVVNVVENQDAYAYEFSVKMKNKDNVQTFQSFYNSYNLSSYFAAAEVGDYTISVRLIAKNNKFSSKPVSQKYVNTKKLAAPTIRVEDNFLKFEENINTQNYKLICVGLSNKIEIDIDNSFKINSTYSIDLENLNEIKSLPAGSYNIQIVASANGYFQDSILSNMCVYKYTKALTDIDIARFDESSKILYFSYSDKIATSFIVTINESIICKLKYTKEGNQHFDLFSILSSTTVTSMSVYVTSDNTFISDSNAVNVDII